MIPEPLHTELLHKIVVGACLIAMTAAGMALYQGHLIRTSNDNILPENNLFDKINPNTATWPSLARLPGIGPAKAKRIIDYRESVVKDNPDRLAFEAVADLEKVPTIGPLTVEDIRNYLYIK